MADLGKVVLTDYVWDSLDVEKRALEGLALPLESGQTRGPAGVGGSTGSRYARYGPGDPDLPK